ncbi:hypothetical protein BDQ17DRAFT_677361 [Cyathus striatus]|nr:hypothetical protein BDQ17DRAFT_677361 [Cyathus striatus]
MEDLERLQIDLPPCLECGYLTGVLDKIPPRTISTLNASSYYIPSTDERSTIEDHISSSETSILTVEAELAKLYVATKILESRRKNLREYEERQCSLLSSLRQVPDELLSEIFAYVICEKEIQLTDGSSPIWGLQQVCVRWRDLVQNTPLLWCNIMLKDYRSRYNPAQAAHIAMQTKLCLKFSRTTPLSVSIMPVYDSTARVVTSVLEDIAKHAHRWQFLHLDGNFLHHALRNTKMGALIQQHGLVQLRKLCVTYYDEKVLEVELPLDFFRSATTSTLEEVFISCAFLPYCASVFPWANVKRLNVSYHYRCEELPNDDFEISSMFCALTSLEELTWCVTHRRHTSTGIVTLPSLCTLIMDSEEMFEILPMLCVPRLANIQIMNDVGDLHPLLSMLQMSNCIIRKMKLYNLSLPFSPSISNFRGCAGACMGPKPFASITTDIGAE